METIWPALYVVLILAAIVAGVALAILPGVAISRWILVPIDRAAKFRKASAAFSIGDFLCLFVAVQVPLAAIYRFLGEGNEPYYWVFTILTWMIAPVIWIACARALSKAGVTNAWHRIVFLGLIVPLVYYGLFPFTLIGIAFLFRLFDPSPMPVGALAGTWVVLCLLFVCGGFFVRWMLSKTKQNALPITEREHENELALAAMRDRPSISLD
jgi:hypothetical protein